MIRALWIGIQIPENTDAGEYNGTLKLRPDNSGESAVKISLKISDEIIEDHGDNELWRHSRLRWLNSTIGLDDDITAPYVPLKADGKSVECLGRKVKFAANGLPESIISNSGEILSAPISMTVETDEGEIPWQNESISLVKTSPGTMVWESRSSNQQMKMECQSQMEFDGYVNFRISMSVLKDTDVNDIRLDIPIKREIAVYMMGMGCEGGYRPKEWKWVWDEKLANNSIWIGDVSAGLHCKLKGTEDIWELYSLKASGIPKDWNNSGKGGCEVFEKGDDTVILRAYSGERSLTAGEKLDFCFSFLITPLKPLDPAHWNQRYYHAYVPIETVKESGANIINVHHGN